ncbi:MarR family winged helix-turn-helix transcriptional regulator [Psychrobium sp. 1_MG-2023]|uniref:MarR family winged helix-turn-helix transcriptional regulator n=1 Tax=Psychrobium sp. 1_MG-2023 TaxID=3062624 RepID=UPI000C3358E2|nr:MarR family winged helix-turn-helix transcriptional regulator [Psychrobium sp. 1_MG-2023]MDP2562877.1 MarR family winged helix-turn-helix transcriptional regulator [Psychrobium sp. 1_MG-2023]PKF57146.1 MarR family transcriptional regulator [Alteromonadales bacterium alter-6D02]
MKPSLELNQYFPYQFSILAQQMSEYIAKIYKKQYGLSRFEWRVLACVGQQHCSDTTKTISGKDIMQITQLDKMQVSRAIAKLQQGNYLSQETSTTDRRANTVVLTSQGELLYQEIVPLVLAQEQALLSHLSDIEQQQLIAITRKLSQKLAHEQ